MILDSQQAHKIAMLVHQMVEHCLDVIGPDLFQKLEASGAEKVVLSVLPLQGLEDR